MSKKIASGRESVKDTTSGATSKPRARESVDSSDGLFFEGAHDASGENNPYMRPFSQSLPMMLLLARETVMSRFRRLLHESGLNEQQWRVLRALIEVEYLDITELSNRVHVLKPSLTRMLNTLESSGLILRRRSSTDQRYSYISITPAGQRKFKAVAPFSEAEYARISREFGADKLRALYELLDELIQTIGDAPR
ncbi:homoprotocatechuate degradation operon regulator HpaR [uncultured Hyphomonas sp.]|uniref:homoprotocatechuate degradation operon regulator HpaR n=1 Tax=uncultured Hyphomonas sp. TaxID=225298 RepID=UPI002AAC2E15|nr:homoprotocatechuate degradation operon regulator HpaR [uncultured Hyphomonas sp.]